MRKEAEVLEHIAHASLSDRYEGAVLRIEDDTSVDRHPSGPRPQESGHRIDDCRLPGARGSEQGGDAGPVDTESRVQREVAEFRLEGDLDGHSRPRVQRAANSPRPRKMIARKIEIVQRRAAS